MSYPPGKRLITQTKKCRKSRSSTSLTDCAPISGRVRRRMIQTLGRLISHDSSHMTLTDKPAAGDDRAGGSRRPVVWLEVEDFLRYFDHFRSPTGLQRLPFEIYVEAEKLY